MSTCLHLSAHCTVLRLSCNATGSSESTPEVADGVDDGEGWEADEDLLVDVAELGPVLQDGLLGGRVQDGQHRLGRVHHRQRQLLAPQHQVLKLHLQALLVVCGSTAC